MTNDTRTADDIERDIANEREQLSDTFNDLQKKFSIDTIVNDIGTMVRDQGGDIGRSVKDTVARNPAAVALVGVGLAWLVLGKDRTAHGNGTPQHSGQYGGRNRTRGSSLGWDELTRANDHSFSDGDQTWYDSAQATPDPRFRGQATGGGSHDTSDTGTSSAGVTDRVRSGASAAGQAISGAAGSMGQSASDLTERLSHGLDDLSDEAKARVLSARRAAHDARQSSLAAMNRGTRAASDFYDDQPLVVGALAVAVGAAIGAALPHSRVEDGAMGESSDRLFAEAQAVFREERDKAMAAARSAASDVKSDVKEMGSELADSLPDGKTISDAAIDHASDAAGRIADRTSGKADPTDQKLQSQKHQG